MLSGMDGHQPILFFHSFSVSMTFSFKRKLKKGHDKNKLFFHVKKTKFDQILSRNVFAFISFF